MKQKFDVTGMSCAACSARVDKCVSALEGVESVSVNLLKNNMIVEYDSSALNERQIISAVEKGGYGASVSSEGEKKQSWLSRALSPVLGGVMGGLLGRLLGWLAPKLALLAGITALGYGLHKLWDWANSRFGPNWANGIVNEYNISVLRTAPGPAWRF